jgi:hypothetical protein
MQWKYLENETTKAILFPINRTLSIPRTHEVPFVFIAHGGSATVIPFYMRNTKINSVA